MVIEGGVIGNRGLGTAVMKEEISIGVPVTKGELRPNSGAGIDSSCDRGPWVAVWCDIIPLWEVTSVRQADAQGRGSVIPVSKLGEGNPEGGVTRVGTRSGGAGTDVGTDSRHSMGADQGGPKARVSATRHRELGRGSSGAGQEASGDGGPWPEKGHGGGPVADAPSAETARSSPPPMDADPRSLSPICDVTVMSSIWRVSSSCVTGVACIAGTHGGRGSVGTGRGGAVWPMPTTGA